MHYYKVLLIEDDPIFQIKIETMLFESIYQLIKTIDTPSEVIDFVETGVKIDIILCDLYFKNLPLEKIFMQLQKYHIPIICITASKEEKDYLNISKYVSHYLVKSFHKLTLIASLEKAINLAEQTKNNQFINNQYIFLSNKRGSLDKINFQEIYYIEADKNYNLIYTAQKGKYAIKLSMVKLLTNLLDKRFIRIHHKFAINSHFIKNISSNKLELINGLILPVSYSYSVNLKIHRKE